MEKRIETTFLGVVQGVSDKRPETAGSPPKTTLTLDCHALDANVRSKLFELHRGHPVEITITEVQLQMPVEPDDRPVPSGFEGIDGGLDPTKPV